MEIKDMKIYRGFDWGYTPEKEAEMETAERVERGWWSRLGRWRLVLVVLALCVVIAGISRAGQYVWLETVAWLPSSDAVLEMDGWACSTGLPDKVIVWNPAGNDFWCGVLFTRDAATDTTGVTEYRFPDAGKGIPGRVEYLVSTSATDTLLVEKYRFLGRH